MPKAQVAPTSTPLSEALHLHCWFALLPFSDHRDATTHCPASHSRSLSQPLSPRCYSLTYLVCVYPTGPPATPWGRPDGPLCAFCTGCS